MANSGYGIPRDAGPDGVTSKTIPITIFAACSNFHPEVARREGLRMGVQMIAKRLRRSITDAATEQLFDEV